MRMNTFKSKPSFVGERASETRWCKLARTPSWYMYVRNVFQQSPKTFEGLRI